MSRKRRTSRRNEKLVAMRQREERRLSRALNRAVRYYQDHGEHSARLAHKVERCQLRCASLSCFAFGLGGGA